MHVVFQKIDYYEKIKNMTQITKCHILFSCIELFTILRDDIEYIQGVQYIKRIIWIMENGEKAKRLCKTTLQRGGHGVMSLHMSVCMCPA